MRVPGWTEGKLVIVSEPGVTGRPDPVNPSPNVPSRPLTDQNVKGETVGPMSFKMPGGGVKAGGGLVNLPSIFPSRFKGG
jgi:hypothetical protein